MEYRKWNIENEIKEMLKGLPTSVSLSYMHNHFETLYGYIRVRHTQIFEVIDLNYMNILIEYESQWRIYGVITRDFMYKVDIVDDCYIVVNQTDVQQWYDEFKKGIDLID